MSSAAGAGAGAVTKVDDSDDEVVMHKLAAVGRGARLTAYTKHLHTLASDAKKDWVQEASFYKGVKGNPDTELARMFNCVQRLREDEQLMRAMGEEDIRVTFEGDGKGVLIVCVCDVLFPSFSLRLNIDMASKVVTLLHVSNPVPGLGPLYLKDVRVTWEMWATNRGGRGKSNEHALCIRDPLHTGFDIVITAFPQSF